MDSTSEENYTLQGPDFKVKTFYNATDDEINEFIKENVEVLISADRNVGSGTTFLVYAEK